MPQSENFYVAVRVRPPNKKEQVQKSSSVIYIESKQTLHFDPPLSQNAKSAQQSPQRGQKNLQFSFDRVYDDMSTNNEIFTCSIKPMIDAFLSGMNCSVFAYGATASGKTYTVFGAQQDGLIFYILDEVFANLHLEDVVEQQFVEIYNEQLRDLLSADYTSLQLREDPIYGCFIPNLTTYQIASKQQAFYNVIRAFSYRQTNATDENAASSRSHSIMFLTLKRANFVAKFAVTDLAGSERLKRTNAVGVRAFEGGNINKSLLALGNCLQALCKANAYVPYRNSKLTRLLKDSLSGNSRVCMIANVSPAFQSYDDTLNTLCYAQRAGLIKTQAKVNVVAFYYTTAELNQMIYQYKEENALLQAEIKEIRANGPTGQGAAQPSQQIFESLKKDIFSTLQQILVLARQYYYAYADRKLHEFTTSAKAYGEVVPQEVLFKSQIAQLKQKVLATQQKDEFKQLALHFYDNLKLLVENGQSCLAQIAYECYIAFLEKKAQFLEGQKRACDGYMKLAKAAFDDLLLVTEVCGVSQDELREAKTKFAQAFASDLTATVDVQRGGEQSTGDITINQLNTEQMSTLTFNLNQTLPTTTFQPPKADLRRAQNLQSFRAKRVPGLARPAEKKYEEQIGELEKQLSEIGDVSVKLRSRMQGGQ